MRFCYSVQLGATRCNSVHLRYSHNSNMLWAGILKFKFRIVVRNIFCWRMADLKNELHCLKKATFSIYQILNKYTLDSGIEVSHMFINFESFLSKTYDFWNCFQALRIRNFQFDFFKTYLISQTFFQHGDSLKFSSPYYYSFSQIFQALGLHMSHPLQLKYYVS